MKRCCGVLFFIFFSQMYSQHELDQVDLSYSALLDRIESKDTLVNKVRKTYKCSGGFSGSIDFYYKNDSLRLIKHLYKQGFYGNSILEYYYVNKSELVLQTTISEAVFMNTVYKDSVNVTSFSAEKVIEVTECRMRFDKDKIDCYERKHGEKLSDWDQDFFEALGFKNADCTEDIEDVQYKYRLLRKARKKLINYQNKEPSCIFHLW